MKEHAIGIDLGGTTIKSVLMTRSGEIHERVQVHTQDDPEGISENWKNNVREAAAPLIDMVGRDIPIGLSAPGLTDPQHRCISYMPGRLQGLEGCVWSHYLEVDRVSVINDAKSALLAESRFGAAKGYKDVLLMTLGTGVGGGLLINGEIYEGFLHRAGHIGHISMDKSAPRGILNLPGTLEYFTGNATVSDRSEGVFKSTRDLLAAYRSGDAYAREVWLESIERLAIGLCSLINVISPQIIVLGGGIVLADQDLFGPLADRMAIYEWRPSGISTPIVRAEYSQFAGAVGAAIFAFEQRKL